MLIRAAKVPAPQKGSTSEDETGAKQRTMPSYTIDLFQGVAEVTDQQGEDGA